MLGATGDRRDVVVHNTVSPQLDPAIVDPLRMRDVVAHLVGNAKKFSRDGGRVEVRAGRADATRFYLEVQDHGIGIAEADITRLFTRFTQLSGGTTRHYSGAGLGLALVRQLVELQGGSASRASPHPKCRPPANPGRSRRANREPASRL
jgi:signal transduction histidine kinase